ncbi:unnamed protein product [Schistosoma turkestanicum]|nr:unnamed protein product [Schistosoma turkestanicum]
MWSDLKASLAKKPPDTSSAATQDEYFVELQSRFVQLIIRFPLFAVEQKIELEMWNVLYKTQISSLQSLLHQRLSGIVNSGSPKCSTMELKLRLVLLLDRASGIYFNLIYQLLQPVSELPWPKAILGILASVDGFSDSENNRKVKHISDYLDLDLATFSANRAYSKRMRHMESNKFPSTLQESDTNIIAPRILSRGDRLPSEVTTVTSSIEDSKINGQIIKSPDEFGDESKKEKTEVNANQSSDHHLDREAAVIYLVHHCLVHLGDIARYRQQPNVAAGYYLWSWVVHPDSGHSFNQLAILEATKPLPSRSMDALFYYYIRALACLHSFPAAMNNLSNILLDYYKSFESTLDNNNHEKQPPTDSINDVVSTAKRWPKFTNQQIQTLIQFYTALYLHKDPVKLIKMADDLFETMNNWDKVELDKNQLIHLVCIHFYLTDHYLSDTKSNLSSFETSNEKPFLLNEYQTGTALLLCLTIHLINWITSSIIVDDKTLKTVSSNEQDILNIVSNGETTTDVNNNGDFKNSDTFVDNDNHNDSISNDENPVVLSSPTTEIPYTSHDNNNINIETCKLQPTVALNLLFLWFRSNHFTKITAGINKSSYQLTDKLFVQLSTPIFTKNTVYFLNNLLKHYQPLLHNHDDDDEQTQPIDVDTHVQLINNNIENMNNAVNSEIIIDSDVVEEECENCTSSESHIINASDNNSHDSEADNITPIDWISLMKLPEIVLLQGFQPLHIPTQRSLCSSSSSIEYNPVNPFLLDFSINKFDELICSTNENIHEKNISKSYEIGLERILCLLTSARYIAQIFPSLINWAPNSKDENSYSTQTTSGSFCCSSSSHSPNNLNELFSVLNKPTTMTITSNNNEEETQSNITIVNNLDEGPNLHESTIIPSSNNEQLLHIIPTTTHHETMKVNLINNNAIESLSSSSEVTTTTSNDVVVPSSSTTTTISSSSSSLPSSLLSHVGTSGGLIMNAELAKFIQEQASQVAARQQRSNMSTNSIINDNHQQQIGGSTTGALIPSAATTTTTTCENSDVGSLDGNSLLGGKTSLSRLSLSATFKRNLPPRYAKLLQAKELQEKETLKNRYSYQTQNELNSSLLPYDHQPAPLARKESEAPTDLIYLLSSSDVINPIGLHLPHEQTIHQHHHQQQHQQQQQPQWF